MRRALAILIFATIDLLTACEIWGQPQAVEEILRLDYPGDYRATCGNSGRAWQLVYCRKLPHCLTLHTDSEQGIGSAGHLPGHLDDPDST